jgi:hypothetical protein
VGVRGDPDPVVVGVPADRPGDVPGPQVPESFPFLDVVLADVLGQDVDDPTMTVEQRAQRAARANRAELTVVPDHDHLGAGHVAGGEEAEHVPVVGHPGFIDLWRFPHKSTYVDPRIMGNCLWLRAETVGRGRRLASRRSP